MNATATLARPGQTALFAAADSKLGSGKYGLLDNKSYIKGPNDNDILVLKDVPLFRSGEFADSMGIESLWEAMHMFQMESNFTLLQAANEFTKVPIRCNHDSIFGKGLENVIGHVMSVRTEEIEADHYDGKKYTYLLGELHIYKEDAQKNILDGLWGARSSEIGPFRTNNKAEYWPTFYGVAFVDIPAVQGLDFSMRLQSYVASKQDPENFSLMTEEKSMDPQNPNPAPPAPTAPATGPTFEFSIGGKKVSDFGAVQAHISQLETRNSVLEAAQTEAIEADRVAYAKALVTSGRVLATQEEATIEFCKGMQPEQFASYKTIMDSVSVQPVLGKYGAQVAAPGTAPASADAVKSERISILKEQVQAHSYAGKKPDQIKEFGSYKELIALDPTFVLK